MDPARAAALQVALGLPVTAAPGVPLPPFFHNAYFWSPKPSSALGRDGHSRVGRGLIPDMGLPRRMWAGGRMEFRHPLHAGVGAEKHSVLERSTRKQGRSGQLGFVTLRNEIRQQGQICITEWQDLVYREDADPAAPQPEPPRARHDEEIRRTVSFDTTLLFRYSALTFNGHRIHYDLDYARAVEGYGGLVVHGPLLAQLLMLLAQDERGPLAAFHFRARSPLLHFETAELCLKNNTLWVARPGRAVVHGSGL